MACHRGLRRDRCRKDLHGDPSFLSGREGDKSSMGESESVHRSQDAVLSGCLLHGLASGFSHSPQSRWDFREGSIGISGLMLCLLQIRLTWAQHWLTRVFLPLFRFMSSVCPHSASLSFWQTINSWFTMWMVVPQGFLIISLAPSLATQPPWPSQGSSLRMRLIITVLHMQEVALYTVVKVHGEVQPKSALSSQLPSCYKFASSACADWFSCHVTSEFIFA
jgi:hypothetical protein